MYSSLSDSAGAGAHGNNRQLGEYWTQFRLHLLEQGYGRATIATYDCCVRQLDRRMGDEGITVEDLDESQALELLRRSGGSQRKQTYAAFIVKRFVGFLIQQGAGKPAPAPTAKANARAELRQDYETYLRRQRGLSERTIFHCWRFADRFLAFRFGEEVGDLSRITATDIAHFLEHLTAHRRPFRDKTPATHLRNFFRFLFTSGRIAINLALTVPSVAQRYAARLPRHLTTDQVETLIQAVGSDTPRGRRNHAMVLLLARLGLRASEVIAMQIDDIDWRSGEIIVRGKGHRHDRLPLPADVGAALAEYIRRDRVATSRVLFVTDRPPHRPFKNGEVLNGILRDACARTGLKLPAPFVGSHIFRHSLATNLVQRGASLEEIADMLRHRSRASTMIYAKLDIEGLRSIARPWPLDGGAQ